MARHMKALEKENVRLKKLVAEQALDNQILKEAARQGRAAVPGPFGRCQTPTPASATKSTPTSSNMPAARFSISPNCPGTPEPTVAVVSFGLDRSGIGCDHASNRLGAVPGRPRTPEMGQGDAPGDEQVQREGASERRTFPLSPNPSPPDQPRTPTRNQISYQQPTADLLKLGA